jgi:prevent-host-death family protein
MTMYIQTLITMTQFNIAEAKAHLSKLIQKAMLGDEVIIAKDHHPVVKIVPISKPQKKRKPGSGAGELLFMADDFNETPDDFEKYI